MVTPITLDLDQVRHALQVNDVVKAANDIFEQKNRKVRQDFGKSPDNINHSQHNKKAANFRSIAKFKYFEGKSKQEPKLISEQGYSDSGFKPPEIAQTQLDNSSSQILEQSASND